MSGLIKLTYDRDTYLRTGNIKIYGPGDVLLKTLTGDDPSISVEYDLPVPSLTEVTATSTELEITYNVEIQPGSGNLVIYDENDVEQKTLSATNPLLVYS